MNVLKGGDVYKRQVCYMPIRPITLDEDKKYSDWVASGDPNARCV